MRLIDADELMEHIGRDKLDSREAIMEMVKNAPTALDAEIYAQRVKDLEGVLEHSCLECERLKAQIRALVFALRCNGVSG